MQQVQDRTDKPRGPGGHPDLEPDSRSRGSGGLMPDARARRDRTANPLGLSFSLGSDFGLRKPLRIFGFRGPVAARLPTRFGIRSDFGFIGRSGRKTRYGSSAFGTDLVIFCPTHNRQVAGSSPAGPTIFSQKSCGYGPVAA